MRLAKLALIVGIVTVMALATLATPVASAAPTARFSPPYSGGQKVTNLTVSPFPANCAPGANGSEVGRTAARLATGIVHVYAGAKVSGTSLQYYCGDAVSAREGFQSPGFNVSSTGKHNVTLRWLLSWSASAKYHGYSAAAGAEGFIIGFLWDATTGSEVAHSHHFKLFFYLAPAGTSTGVNVTQFMTISGVLNVGHSYRAVTSVEARASADFAGGGTASAYANLESGGNQGALTWIAVS